MCHKSLKTFEILAESLGLPINAKKTVLPTTTVELHGILFNTESMTMHVPPDKVVKALDLLDRALNSKSITLQFLQSICGTLAFFTHAIPTARGFIRRLYMLSRGLTNPTHHVRLKAPARSDLLAWQYFLQHFNNSKILSRSAWAINPDWKVFSDASGKSYAAVLDDR